MPNQITTPQGNTQTATAVANPYQAIINTLNSVSDTLELASYYVADVAEHYSNIGNDGEAKAYLKFANNISFNSNAVHSQLSILTDGEPLTKADLAELAEVTESTAEILKELGYNLLEIETETQNEIEPPFDFELCFQLAADLQDITTDLKGGN